jgi:hypothetical protein
MTATVLHMRDYRAIFALPDPCGTVAVFLASRGNPRLAHERRFTCGYDALIYADQLASRFDCAVIGREWVKVPRDEDAA